MANFSINTTDAAGSVAVAYVDGFAALTAFVSDFRATNDYADNSNNPATISVTRLGYGAGVAELFWAAATGFFGRRALSAAA